MGDQRHHGPAASLASTERPHLTRLRGGSRFGAAKARLAMLGTLSAPPAERVSEIAEAGSYGREWSFAANGARL